MWDGHGWTGKWELETRRLGDSETRGLGDSETRGLGDSGTRRLGDSGTRSLGDSESRGLGDSGIGDSGLIDGLLTQSSFNAGCLETVKRRRGQLWKTFLTSNCVFFSRSFNICALSLLISILTFTSGKLLSVKVCFFHFHS